MKIIKVQNNEEAGLKAAEIFKKEIKNNPKCVLGLATGSTPKTTYKHLIKFHKHNDLDFSDVKTFNLDEYYPIKKENIQSYHYFMHIKLFDHINVKPENVNIIDGECDDYQKSCDDFEKMIEENPIDIQLLGIGSNGHIAFNEPNTPFTQKTHLVQLTESTINDNARFFDHHEEIPLHALTMGLATIMKAKKIVLIATGKNKANAVKHMIQGDKTPLCPASILQDHSDCTIIVDEEAAELIEE